MGLNPVSATYLYDFGSITYQGLCASSVKQGLLEEINHIFQVCTTDPKEPSMKVDSLLLFTIIRWFLTRFEE